MTRLTAFMSILFCSAFLSGCTSNKSGQMAKVTPEKTIVSGPLGDFVEVVDNPYEISGEWGGKLSVRLKAKAKVSDDLLKDKDWDMAISLLGENSQPVSGTGDFTIDYASKDKLLNILTSGSGEEVVMFNGNFNYNAEKDAERVKKFYISSKITEKEKESVSTDQTSSVAGGSKDWDKLLNDYEDYINQYIKFFKKAKEGDNSALVEYPSLMQKAMELEKSIKAAQDEKGLSTEQASRFLKLQMKLATAAAAN